MLIVNCITDIRWLFYNVHESLTVIVSNMYLFMFHLPVLVLVLKEMVLVLAVLVWTTKLETTPPQLYWHYTQLVIKRYTNVCLLNANFTTYRGTHSKTDITCIYPVILVAGKLQTWVFGHKPPPILFIITFCSHVTMGSNMICCLLNESVHINENVPSCHCIHISCSVFW